MEASGDGLLFEPILRKKEIETGTFTTNPKGIETLTTLIKTHKKL